MSYIMNIDILVYEQRAAVPFVR